jgi:hypothetical protein
MRTKRSSRSLEEERGRAATDTAMAVARYHLLEVWDILHLVFLIGSQQF